MRASESVEVEPEMLGGSAAALCRGAAYVSQEHTGPSELAAALVYAMRAGTDRMVLFADEGAGVAARLSTWLAPGLEVAIREVDGRGSVRAKADPMPILLPGPTGAGALVGRLEDAGLEAVLEGGEWRGELLGLEVARIVRWPTEAGGDDELHIEVGVGRFDRDASAAVRAGEPPSLGIRRVIDMVSGHRFEGAPVHPLSIPARARWMRAKALSAPSVVAAVGLRAVETTFPPGGIRDERPAAALGRTVDGEPLTVVFGVGSAFELVPIAADTRELQAPGRRLRLVVPPKDHMGVLDELVVAAASAGRGPVDVHEMDPPWAT